MNINTYSAYQEMNNNGQWTGGWVQLMDGTIVYITRTGEIERKENNNELGSEENPFSNTAYQEMVNKHEWVGGYVMMGEDCEYIPQQNEGGDGCGCGCGCGCGTNNLTAGSAQPIFARNFESVRIQLFWGSGEFNVIGPLPSLSYDSSNSFYLHRADASAPYERGALYTVDLQWESPYRIKVDFTYPYGGWTDYYDIPYNFRS